MDLDRLDRRSRTPLHRQLYERLRGAILAGRLPPGARLPSSRALQEQLGVGRNTVLEAFTQLAAEGYLQARRGSGTFVADALPDDLVAASSRPASGGPVGPLSRRGRLIAGAPSMPAVGWRTPRPFYPGIPAYELLPIRTWRALTNARWRSGDPTLLDYGTPHGYRPLREAIARHLVAVRGVDCDPDRVIVVAGSQQALDLTARVLLDDGDPVWIEDPAYPGARAALAGAGTRLVPVPVDRDGLDVDAAVRLEPGARLAYVSPSHQYPLGYAMSVARRLALLRWAAAERAWIVEDDYDSEFRYRGRQFPALQGLDEHGCVIYVGTFSKVLFPSLRLGYLVVPAGLVDAFAAARALSDRHPPTVEQAVLADFLDGGHFLRHVRRMRLVYARRQARMLDAAARHLDGLLEVSGDDAGMHLVGWLPPGVDDAALAERCARGGLSVPPLSYYYVAPPRRGGLLLGYTGFSEAAIAAGVRRLSGSIRCADSGSSRRAPDG